MLEGLEAVSILTGTTMPIVAVRWDTVRPSTRVAGTQGGPGGDRHAVLHLDGVEVRVAAWPEAGAAGVRLERRPRRPAAVAAPAAGAAADEPAPDPPCASGVDGLSVRLTLAVRVHAAGPLCCCVSGLHRPKLVCLSGSRPLPLHGRGALSVRVTSLAGPPGPLLLTSAAIWAALLLCLLPLLLVVGGGGGDGNRRQ
jgi:hypothetical protein